MGKKLNRKKALVLSSGILDGAFQAGAIKRIFETGFRPDIIAGNGIGALHTIFIASELGRTNNKISLNTIAKNLELFWRIKISSSRDLLKRKSLLKLASQILRKKFVSLYDTSELEEHVLSIIDVGNIHKSSIEAVIGAINVFSGETEYFNLRSPYLIEAIFASYSLPFMMPYVFIENIPYIDAAERHIIPVRYLLENYDISEMIIVLAHPTKLSYKKFNPGNLNQLIYRTKYITDNELLHRDLRFLKEKSKKIKLSYQIIEPDKEANIDITRFTKKQIEEVIDAGYRKASEILEYSKTTI